MSTLYKRKKDKQKISWKSLWSALALILGVTIFIFVTLTVSWLLEARSSQKSGQEITLKAEEKTSWSGSQISPLHRIPLMDEFNQKIVPAAPDSLPFSARYTCGPCHNYQRISGGSHFSLHLRPETDRATEPWVLVEEKAGVQLPVSFQKYPGLWSPERLGLNSWQFVNLFGRNLVGGGLGEPAEKDETPDSRWNVSGKLEINCLGCHNKSPLQDHSEWVKQVMRQNFRWAATAASGLGEVGGMASRLPSTWSIVDGPNPDDREWAVVPQVKYNQSFFDSRNNVVLDLAHQPEDSRCLACHSVTSRKSPTKAALERDVHSVAGLKCVDCHRNDLSHEMVRGFEGQKLRNSGLKTQDFTCAGCHLGQKPEKGGFGFAGKLGAPRPSHKGIPKVHFERLSCTVCHSGPLPDRKVQEVYTSRANRLGVFGKAHWTSEYPVILEPVFVREKDKKIYPERVIWPAFWAEKKGKELVPVNSQEILQTAPEVFLFKENIADWLNSLLPLAEDGFYPAVVISGYLFEPNVDGSLDVRPLEKAPLSGKPRQGKFILVQVKKGEVKPLLTAFNPEEASPELEDKILRSLLALKSKSREREPVLEAGNFIYKITEGYLDKAEKAGQPRPEPEIGWLEGENIQPLFSDFQVRILAKLKDGKEILTEEQVALVLEKLTQSSPEKEFAYVTAGRVFSLDKGGKLKVAEHQAARPFSWPLAHVVRPAQQALGKNGCTDCHSPGAGFFFGKVEASSPLKTSSKETKLQADWMKTGTLFQFLFGITFLVRPAFKLLLAGCLLVTGLILLVVAIRITGKITGLKDDEPK